MSDILLWQRIFEANGLWTFDADYQTGHVAILVGMLGLGGVLLLDSGFWALWFGGALYTMAFGGGRRRPVLLARRTIDTGRPALA